MALLVTAIAIGLRLLADPVLPPGYPYLTFFPAVILTTFFCGLRPGILSAVLCGFAAWFFFIPPMWSFVVDYQNAFALTFYAFIVTVDIALIHFMHVASKQLQQEQKVTAGLFEQQRTMFQELQHRVANNMTFVSSLLMLQKRHVGNDPKRAAAALDEAQQRLNTMSRIHRQLYDPAQLDRPLGEYLQGLCADLLDATGARNIACLVDMPSIRFDLPQLTTLSLIVTEVVTNAIKHAYTPEQRGTITIRLEQMNHRAMALTIADDGKGIPADFDPQASRSLGFRIVQSLSQQMQGRLSYTGQDGTVFRLEFPEVQSAGALA